MNFLPFIRRSFRFLRIDYNKKNSTRARKFTRKLTTGHVAEEGKIVKSPAPYLTLPKGNFVNTVFENFHKWSSKTALECFSSKRKVTFADLEEQTARWSDYLKQIGVQKGDIVTIISPNCIEFVPIAFGTAAIGATLSPINWKSTSDEVRRMLKITNSKHIIFGLESERLASETFQGKTDNLRLFSIGKPNELKAKNVKDILEGGKGVPALTPEKISGEETIFMPFSSGTTGPPKAAAISHNAFIAGTLQFCNPFHDSMRETTANFQETAMGMLPFFHIYGFCIILCIGLYKGNKIIVLPRSDRKSFLSAIINHKVDRVHTVPTLLNILNNSPEVNPETMGHITTILCGAAPVSETEASYFRKKIKKENLPFFEGYGMTETLVTNQTSRKFLRLGTCGHLLSNVEAKVINQETGELLGELEQGEICVKTPAMMTEYVNNPKETANLIRDGWVHTGDVGYYDKEGCFYIVDRTKDLIKVKGMQVSPSEIEDKLLMHPSVQECSVVGIPDDFAGEVPKAFIVLREDATASDINKFLEKKLSKYKQLVGGISFVDSLPKSETGKVLKRILREQA